MAQLVGDMYRNEAIAGEVDFTHSGLRPGSRARDSLRKWLNAGPSFKYAPDAVSR